MIYGKFINFVKSDRIEKTSLFLSNPLNLSGFVKLVFHE